MKVYMNGTIYVVQNREEADKLVLEYANEHDLVISCTAITPKCKQYILKPREIPTEVIECYDVD